MINDLEQLKLAAKAAGLKYFDVFDDDSGFEVVHFVEGRGREIWNPLTSDNDALRLAVKLGLDICFGWDSPAGKITNVIINGDDVIAVENDDPYAATRRAIVRAAAEIGKQTEVTE